MIYKFKWVRSDYHIRVHVWAGTERHLLAKVGDLTFRLQEWNSFKAMLGGDAGDDIIHRSGNNIIFEEVHRDMSPVQERAAPEL